MNPNAKIRELASLTDISLYFEPDNNPSPLAFAMLAMFHEKHPGTTTKDLVDISGDMDGLATPPEMAELSQMTDHFTELVYKIHDLEYRLRVDPATQRPVYLPTEADQLVYHAELNHDSGVESLYFARLNGVCVAVSNFGDCSMAAAPWVLTLRRVDLPLLFPDVTTSALWTNPWACPWCEDPVPHVCTHTLPVEAKANATPNVAKAM